jgi:thiopeptide-type bacteriocin biosynthesis protein
MKKNDQSLIPAGFFILRTPTLPWDEIEQWSQGLAAYSALIESGDVESALHVDTAILRNRLREIVRRPEIRGALYVASPSLNVRLDPWLNGEESEKALSVELTIIRYFMRMAGRATPFGLFAGTSVGTIDQRTRLQVPPLGKQLRHTRLDIEYVCRLIDRLSKNTELLAELRFRANLTMYKTGGRLRYYETRVSGQLRTFHLVDVNPSPYLNTALDVARRSEGATMREISEAIVANFYDVEMSDAIEFVKELVDAQLLCNPLTPYVTGQEPVSGLIENLRTTKNGVSIVKTLENVLDDLKRLDGDGFRVEPVHYESVVVKLRSLPEEVDVTRLFRVDLHKPGTNISLDKTVVDNVKEGVELLARISPSSESIMDNFARQFEQRYQGREIPLLEALDEEIGIGFDVRVNGASSVSSLLAGLTFLQSSRRIITWNFREKHLLHKLSEALQSGASEIILTDVDFHVLSANKIVDYPVGMGVMVSIGAKSKEAFDLGDYQIYMQKSVGTTSAKLFGRFCQGDVELEGYVRSILKKEAEYEPEAIHAEIAYLPQGRAGNVISRPVLREYEIPVLGVSGAPENRQIPLTDLFVSIREGKVHLRSGKHNRRVVPHLTCAHAIRKGDLSIYRFLASLDEQGLTPEFYFSWGPLRSAPFLPRVSSGKFIFSLTQWNIPQNLLNEICALRNAARFLAIQKLCSQLKLPRFVWLVDGDNKLPVDFNNTLSIDSFLSTSKHHRTITLSEIFPPPNELIANGEEGFFHHELIVPFIRRMSIQRMRTPVKQSLTSTPRSNRVNHIGHDWLFAKLYCGVATQDRVLSEIVPSLIRELREEKAIDRWFFIRYNDLGGWHLRLRLRGKPSCLWGDVAPRLFAVVNSKHGIVRKVVIDTYNPEEERYGGKEALEIGEKIFEVDSDAALTIVKEFRADAEARWRLALLGMDALLDDLGFSLEQKKQIVCSCRARQLPYYANDGELIRQLGNKFRLLRPEIETLFVSPPKEYVTGYDAIRVRSSKIVYLAVNLRQIEANARLISPLMTISESYLHMWTNRIFRDSANVQELVLYDFLNRVYNTRIARHG